jgi:glycosyltransferase involved in cell wall biosynthesis
VRTPHDAAAGADALGRLLDDPELRTRQGRAARGRAEREYAYDVLAARLDDALRGAELQRR